jgi:hypothetical protein
MEKITVREFIRRMVADAERFAQQALQTDEKQTEEDWSQAFDYFLGK